MSVGDRIIRAIWCVDSETQEELLIDIDKNEVIAKRENGKILNPDDEVDEHETNI